MRLGDRVRVRAWFFFRATGRVDYIPGASPKKPSLERGGLAWVGIALDDGSHIDVPVMSDGVLKKGVDPIEEKVD